MRTDRGRNGEGREERRAGRQITSLFCKLGATVAATGLKMRMWSQAVRARSLYSHLLSPSPTLQLSKPPPLLLFIFFGGGGGVIRPGPLRLFCKKTQALLLIRPETKINWAAGSSSAFPSLFVCLFHTPARRLIWTRLVINVLTLLLGEEFAAALKCWRGRDKRHCWPSFSLRL